MAKYTVRITNEDGNIVAWIDQDGAKCIMQPGLPGEPAGWESEEQALAWANAHAADLEKSYEESLAHAARKRELEDAQLAAAKAQVESANALAAILAKLTEPSA